MNKFLKYFNTLKFLRFEQFYYRAIFKFYKPKIVLNAGPLLDKKCKNETAFPIKNTSLLDSANGRFCFLKEEHIISKKQDWNNHKINKLWLYNLHYFDFLQQENLPAKDGEYWINKWIEENPFPIGNGWEPYPISLRTVNWIKWFLRGNNLTAKQQESLFIQVRYLRKRLEYHLFANHLLANAKALVFAGMFFDGAEAKEWLKKGLLIYKRELPEQILKDGGHFELSTMYHNIILEDLLDLKNLAVPIENLDKYISKMLFWLSAMIKKDKEISFFNDAAQNVALTPKQLFDYAGKLNIKYEKAETSCNLKYSGYARLANNNWLCLCDGAEIGPSYQTGHSHADTLTFELWYKDTKLITNSGTKEYIWGKVREYQRSTKAHNTIVINSKNSSEVWHSHRTANRAHIINRVFKDNMFSAEHNGYKNITCKRTWQLEENKVIIEDIIKSKKDFSAEIFFHFVPDIKIKIISKQEAEIIQNKDKFLISFNTEDFNLLLKNLPISNNFGEELLSPCLILKTQGKKEKTIITEIKKL
ncbi:MAG: alginate lyase family protein [Elusimicrobiaceae bacterium]|nr:alginate lyase family protein [Elusimicrobiaceae bacterium]